MNRLSQQCIVAVFACIGFIGLLGITGTYEYADEVVYNMPQEVYDTIRNSLGEGCSNKAVANEYMKNREYYDSMR